MAALTDPLAHTFIENFGRLAPYPEAMGGRFTFNPGSRFDIPVLVPDGWYTDDIWSVLFVGTAAKAALRSDVRKPESIDGFSTAVEPTWS